MALLEAMCKTLDPDGLLNPGKHGLNEDRPQTAAGMERQNAN
jgi:hypothetical protein